MSDGQAPLKGGDYALRGGIPAWLPRFVKRWARDLTYNEAHAMELGLLGVLAGAAWWAGLHVPVLAASGVLVAVAFGVRRIPHNHPALVAMDHVLAQVVRGVAGRVIKREPWYFTTVYLTTSTLTVVVLTVIQ